MVASLGGAALTAGAFIAGKYRLVKQLGEGAMGVVWSAINSATNGEVALKLILRSEPELRHRLLREAQACGTIRHRNVVQVHDVGQTDGEDPFLVMELLHGETLADLLARKRRLPPPEAASIGRDVARALAAAHSKGIVHRDLKPANIFLHNEQGGDAPVVKVLDFGVSKNFLQSDGLRTVAGGVVGSPMYMSPEQALTEREIDGRADVWSLGVVVYEMLTGERPFTGETAEVIARITSGEIPLVSRRIRRIDPDFDAIVAGCLTRDRNARLGPAIEVARRLEAHAATDARAPLPSLMEIGPSELAAAAAYGSGSAAFSPGMGPTSLQPASSVDFGRPGSPGLGATGLRPSSSGHGSTMLAPDDDGEDESTRPIAPWMLAPRTSPHGSAVAEPVRGHPPAASQIEPARPGTGTVPMLDVHGSELVPSPPAGPRGTVRMDPAFAEVARAQARAAPVQAQSQTTAFSAFTDAPSVPTAMPGGARRPGQPPSMKLIAGIASAVLLSAIVVFAVVLLRSTPAPPSPAATSVTVEAVPPPSAPPPPPAPTTAAEPSPVASTAAPDPTTASASGSSSAATSAPTATPRPTSTGPAARPNPGPRPTSTTKAAPAPSCTSKFMPCKPPASSGVTDPWAQKKTKPKPIALPEGL